MATRSEADASWRWRVICDSLATTPVLACRRVGLGILPGYGGTVRLARLVGLGRAIQLTLTGEMIAAGRAREIGLVSEVVPRAELLPKAKELLRKVTKNGPVAVRLALESIYHALDGSTPRGARP